MAFLLDTNIISEIRRSRPHPAVISWFGGVPESELNVSVMSIGEIRRGIELLRPRDPRQATTLSDWLDTLHTGYQERIIPVTMAIAQEWGRLNAIRPFPVVDGIIAATAKLYGWTVVTRNHEDFDGSGVPVFDPFEAQTER